MIRDIDCVEAYYDMLKVAEILKNHKDRALFSGLKSFSLKELKKIDLNTRLSLPHEIFVAIDKA